MPTLDLVSLEWDPKGSVEVPPFFAGSQKHQNGTCGGFSSFLPSAENPKFSASFVFGLIHPAVIELGRF